ncbi:MAG: ABC transporter ATP-binding protein/permease [Bifidobacterium sp.]|jgi:ATP-binding cassette subfamily B protein|nr:ABC transporter ATP-binding protein/permease [Bifidobacterium sp.]
MIRDLLTILGDKYNGMFKRALMWIVVSALTEGAMIVSVLPLFKSLFNGTLAWRDFILPLALTAVAALVHVQQAAQSYRVSGAVMSVEHERIGDKLVRLPLGWFHPDTVGQVSQMITKGTMYVSTAAAHLVNPLIHGIVTPAVIAVGVLCFDWRMGLVMIAFIPLLWLASQGSAALVGKADDMLHTENVNVDNRLIEFAQAQRVLRAFGRGEEGYAPLEDAMNAELQAHRRNLWISMAGIAIFGITTQIAFTALIVAGGLFALNGMSNAALMCATLALTARFIQPLMEVGDYSGAIRMARNELDRLAGALNAKELSEPAQPAPIDASRKGEVELNDVRFTYPGTDHTVLDGISVHLNPGTLTALVGPSGSGKTTITRQIARFFEVNGGSVLVGGTDVREQTTEQLMSQLSLVFQDVYLFDDTLYENVRLGRPSATRGEVLAAAELAGVSQMLDYLPNGWQTQVGEGGTALSGGERQRVSIARALLKNAPIVLLDEATSAIDPENEAHLKRSFAELSRNSTVLVIAHKLSTIADADQILVLNGGHIVEHGKHADLLKHGGLYASFWHEREQAQGWQLA